MAQWDGCAGMTNTAREQRMSELMGGFRVRLDTLVILLLAAGLAWWWTALAMSGMDPTPGASLGQFGWFSRAWVVMMAAMMLPSLAPNAAAFADSGRRDAPALGLLFAAGYLLAWSAAGVAAYALFTVGGDLFAGPLAWHSGGRWLTPGILAAAAAYQLTPCKRACLDRCRSARPSSRRTGVASPLLALAAGARGGGWCIASSGALMAGLFALGVMSLTWMAVVAGLVLIEKLGPRPRATNVPSVVLAVLVLGLLVAPQAIPGFVIPDAHPAMPAMTSTS
jgi:predicted metal-binding membrane protein